MTHPPALPSLEELLPGARVGVIGAGVSGRAAARLLLERGRSVVLLDDRDRSDDPEVRELIARGAEGRWGRPDSSPANPSSGPLEGIDAVVVSPGFPEDHPTLLAARAASLPSVGEFELGWACLARNSADGTSAHRPRGKVVAVTGTNGKTTTTMLVRHIVASAGMHAVECGNIGFGMCDAALRSAGDPEGTIYSSEVSSFQLEDCRRFAPDVAMLLNITPDHLDRHGTMENYARAKAAVTARQSPDQWFVANLDDPACVKIARETKARTLYFSTERAPDAGAWLDCEELVLRPPDGKPRAITRLEKIQLVGMHNVSNCLAAACAAWAAGVPWKAIGPALESFGPAPHRLETVAVSRGVRYVNDSKATNIDATVKAVESFSDPIRLIAGGRDKDSPFESILPQLEGRVARAYLIGEAAPKIERAWAGRIEMVRSETMERAISDATDDASEGDVVLLAPGCASFDQFKDYKHRGEVFTELARAVERGAPLATAG